MPWLDFVNNSRRRKRQRRTWTDGNWVHSAILGRPRAHGESTWGDHTCPASFWDSPVETCCSGLVNNNSASLLYLETFWIITSRVTLMTLLIWSGCSKFYMVPDTQGHYWKKVTSKIEIYMVKRKKKPKSGREGTRGLLTSKKADTSKSEHQRTDRLAGSCSPSPQVTLYLTNRNKAKQNKLPLQLPALKRIWFAYTTTYQVFKGLSTPHPGEQIWSLFFLNSLSASRIH